MRSRLVRLMALAICLVAPLGWIAQADAGTTATVEVTGQVVDTSLALTLTTTTFSLGDVDATGNSYDPVTSLAEPFPVGANPYLVPQGVAWVAKQAIQYTVTSPAMWVLRFCSTTESGTLDGSTVLLYMPGSRPPGFGDPVDYFGPNGVKACSSGYPNGVVAGPGINLPYSIYPTFVVRPTDTPRAFSATVQLTLSVFP